MALPLDNPNPKTDAVETEIKKMGPKDLAALPDLDDDDFKVIGALIQYFCFMDLNLRRALETFHAAKMLPKETAFQFAWASASSAAASAKRMNRSTLR